MITKNEIENIAKLAKLSVKDEEYSALLSDLQQMIGFADVVRCADTSGCEPSTQEVTAGIYREDEVNPSLCREQILSNAPLCDEEFFVVRKRA